MDLLIPGQEVLHCNNDVVNQESQDCNDDNEKSDTPVENEVEDRNDNEDEHQENENEVQNCDSNDSENLEEVDENVESENECSVSTSVPRESENLEEAHEVDENVESENLEEAHEVDENVESENECSISTSVPRESENLEEAREVDENVESENLGEAHEVDENVESDNEVQDSNSKDSEHVEMNENEASANDCRILKALLNEETGQEQDCNAVESMESENENSAVKSVLTNGKDRIHASEEKKERNNTSDAANYLISSDSEDVTVVPDTPMITEEQEDSEQKGTVNNKTSVELDKEKPVLAENSKVNQILNPISQSGSSELYKDVPELTEEELQKQKDMYGPGHAAVQYTKIHCSACSKHIGSALNNDEDRFVHPLLKVLVCRKCLDFYTSGEFDKDEDGSELYCRWCGQGGKVLCCSDCCYVFCQKCIRHNFGKMRLEFIKNSDDWKCFVCDPTQMVHKRVECYSFFEYIKKEKERVSTLNDPELLTHDYTYCCQHRNISPVPSKRKPNKNKDVGFDISKEFEKPKKRKIEKIVWNTQEAEEEVICAPDLSLLMDDEEVPSPSKELPPPEPPKTIQGFRIIQLPGRQQPNVVNTYPPMTQPIILNARLARPPMGPNMQPAFAPNLQPAMPPNMQPAVPPNMRPAMPPNMRPAMPPNMQMPQQRFTPIQPRMGMPMQRVMAPVGQQNYGIRFANNAVNPPNLPPGMDHSWFETAIKVTAEAHAKLSYNFSTLSVEKGQAKTIEDLVKVHNKLQEMLSGSINSLIQVRRNLRSEFLNGLNKVKFASAKKPAREDDNDVVFVNSNREPPPLVPVTVPEQPRQYLKVRSVSQLCNVPSECITIPDEVTERLQKKIEEEKKLTEKVSENSDSNKENFPISEAVEEKENPKSSKETGENSENSDKNEEMYPDMKRALFESKMDKMVSDNMRYNFPDSISSVELKRMLSARVYVKKKCGVPATSEVIEEVLNENSSDHVYCID